MVYHCLGHVREVARLTSNHSWELGSPQAVRHHRSEQFPSISSPTLRLLPRPLPPRPDDLYIGLLLCDNTRKGRVRPGMDPGPLGPRTMASASD